MPLSVIAHRDRVPLGAPNGGTDHWCSNTLRGPTPVVSGIVDLLQAVASQFERTVAALPAEAWDNDTPCDITVREVVDHVVAGNIFAVRLLAGAPAAEATAALDADHLRDDPLFAVSASCGSQWSTFAGADEDRVLHHPSGDISVDTFVRFRLGELVVHAWDLAVGGPSTRLWTRLSSRASGIWSSRISTRCAAWAPSVTAQAATCRRMHQPRRACSMHSVGVLEQR